MVGSTPNLQQLLTPHAQVFDEVVGLVDSVLDGFNVCILAYGQTGRCVCVHARARVCPCMSAHVPTCVCILCAHISDAH